MKRFSCLSLLVLLASLSPRLFSQTIRWESLGGPPLVEQRVHLRYADGERRMIGNRTGTYRSTDGGIAWDHISNVPGPNFRVYASSTGALVGVCDTSWMVYESHTPPAYRTFTSTDRGESWHGGFGRTYNYRYVFRGDTIYWLFGTFGWNVPGGIPSVSRSTDGGRTFRCILANTGPPGYTNVVAQHGNVFVRVWSPPDYQKILRSNDGCATWQQMTANRVMFHPPDNLLRTRLIRGPTDDFGPREIMELSRDEGLTWDSVLVADSGFVSLATNEAGMLLALRKPGYEMFRSPDAGRTWHLLGKETPGDPMTTVRFLGATFAVATTGAGRSLRSTDYGSSWSLILDPGGVPIRGTIQEATDSLFIVADSTGAWIESTDAGGTWRSLPCRYQSGEATSLMVLPSGSLFAGSSAGVARMSPGGSWSALFTEGPVLSLSYHSGPLFFAGRPGSLTMDGTIHALDTSRGFSDKAWTFGGQSGMNYGMYVGDYRSLLARPGGRVIACHGSQLLPVSKDRYRSDGGYSRPGLFTTLAADSSGVLWAGNDSMGVFLSTNDGYNWEGSPSKPGCPKILSLAASRSGSLYAGTHGKGVFRTEDGGRTWIESGLSGLNVQALAAGSGERVYAGTPDGFWMSPDGGESWQNITTGLSDRDIRAVVVGPEGSVYCGTWGDGVCRLVDEELPNIVKNPGFERGTEPWRFFTDGSGTYDCEAVDDGNSKAGHLFIETPGTNVQLYQENLTLEPNTRYRLKFQAYSSSGNDVTVLVHKQGEPYTNYGLWWGFELEKFWQTYEHEFVTVGFSGAVSDGRLRFWLAPHSQAMDHYYFDDVSLVKLGPAGGSGGITTEVSDGGRPARSRLYVGYPNPFNPSTTIRYGLPVATAVRLTVHDVLGRLVTVLVDERREAGVHEVRFDGSNLPSGVYFCRIQAGEFTQTKRLILTK